MFKLRETLPSDDEIRRQNLIVRIVFGRADPVTVLEKKTAAIIRHPSIDPIVTSKVLKVLPQILEFVTSETDLFELDVRHRISDMIKKLPLDHEDPILLPPKLSIYVSPTKLTNPPTSQNIVNFKVSQISHVSLMDFEKFAFNSKTLYKYYKNTSFASYLFQNLIYSQNLVYSDKLNSLYMDETQSWQTRLASLLFITNVNERVANDAFYSDIAIYDQIVYDTSYVPDYDVQSIQPLSKISPSASEQDMINYYYSFDPNTTKSVPRKFIALFMSFPFKSGYYVRPDGSLIFSNLRRIDRYSVTSIFTRICDISDIEAAVENVARRVTLEDAISYAAYAKTLTGQGIALMVARRIANSDSILVPTIGTIVRLDDEYNMLSWMTFSCNSAQLMMPVLYRTPTGDQNIALIRDIARSCSSKLGAAILCSPYYIPEIDINYAYAHLQTDAERYVLYTLVLQQYSNISYYAARNVLRPKFGNVVVDLSEYPMSDRPPAPMLEHRDYRAAMFEDVDAIPSDCTGERCLDNYEFVDSQLNELTRHDDVAMTEHQLAAYIAAAIKQDKR